MDKESCISAEERQRQLNDVSRRYIAGQMDVESFAALERRLRPDYASAVRTLAKQGKEELQGVD
jgi:hypothetical protein